MRLAAAMIASLALGMAIAACEQLDQKGGSGGDAGTSSADGGAASGDAAVFTGAGCGIESKSGVELCVATSKCPNVVVDTQSMPSCGFRLRGAAVDLVCSCGGSICSMGAFTTCDEASKLLANQTEGTVCVQVSEGRCTESAASASSSSSTSSGASSGSNKACDQQCMHDCGGGAACASVCNCD